MLELLPIITVQILSKKIIDIAQIGMTPLFFRNQEQKDKVRVKTLYAKRGRIKDAQGNALAVQGKIYSVGFVPGKMDGNSVKLAAKKLGLSKEEIQKKLDQKWVTDDSFVPLIQIKKNIQKDLLNVKGIIVSTENWENLSTWRGSSTSYRL